MAIPLSSLTGLLQIERRASPPEARIPSGKKIRARDAQEAAVQEKRTPGKLKSGQESNVAVRIAKTGWDNEDGPWGTGETGFRSWRSFGRRIAAERYDPLGVDSQITS